MKQIYLEITGITDLKQMIKKVQDSARVGISNGEKQLVEIGKTEAKRILEPYNYTSILYNSISSRNGNTIGDFIYYLIAATPYAAAIEFGKPELSPDISALPIAEIYYKTSGSISTGRIWESAEAIAWKEQHYPGMKGSFVLVGYSKDRDTPDDKPFPQGVHFMDGAFKLMLENSFEIMVNNIKKQIMSLGK
jgi:hypothetical protein